MRTIGFVALCGVFCGFLAGCGGEGTSSAKGGVAVVDLDAVAKSLGRDSEIIQALQQRQDALNQQLSAMQTSFKEQLSEKQIELGDEPSEDELKVLQRMQGQAGLQLNQAQNKAQINLKLAQQQLIKKFKEEVKPIAQAIAEELGMGVVVTKNDAMVLGFSSSNDITELVAERLRAKAPAAAPAPATLPTASIPNPSRSAESPKSTETK